MDDLRQKEADYGIVYEQAGIKDIILPGEIKDILNTILIAEKRAMANVKITTGGKGTANPVIQEPYEDISLIQARRIRRKSVKYHRGDLPR